MWGTDWNSKLIIHWKTPPQLINEMWHLWSKRHQIWCRITHKLCFFVSVGGGKEKSCMILQKLCHRKISANWFCPRVSKYWQNFNFGLDCPYNSEPKSFRVMQFQFMVILWWKWKHTELFATNQMQKRHLPYQPQNHIYSLLQKVKFQQRPQGHTSSVEDRMCNWI